MTDPNWEPTEFSRSQKIRLRLAESMYKGWLTSDSVLSNHTIQDTMLKLEKYVETGEFDE